jgi:hypothetical protein
MAKDSTTPGASGDVVSPERPPLRPGAYSMPRPPGIPMDHPERVAYRKWYNKHGPGSKDVRDKKKVTNDNVEISNLEQYILSQNIDKAADYFTANKNLFNYKTFRQVHGPGAQIVNRLRGVDNLDVFYKIKTSTLSLMTPKIRIFKVHYEKFGFTENNEVDQGKVEVYNQPCYKEFKFSDNFGLETAATAQDYLSRESVKPNWRNIGLKSFSVKQDGRKHGIVENNIECQLILTFKSLKDLQASPPGEPPPEKGGLRYVDLITWAPSKIDRETDTYNPKHYEIKALLGYTSPGAQQLRSLNLSERDIHAVRNIEKLNIVLSLALYGYDLQIKDNGEVEMTANFRGRLETTIGTNQVNIFQSTFRLTKEGTVDISRKVNAEYNISRVYKLRTTLTSLNRQLRKPSCKDERCEARKNLISLVQEDNFFAVILKEALTKNNKIDPAAGILMRANNKMEVKGDGTDMFTFFKEGKNIERLQAVLKKKVGLFKKDVYKTFVDQLIDGNTNENANGTRLFCINAESQVIQESIGIILDDTAGPGITLPEETNNVTADQVRSSPTTAIPKNSATGVKIDRCHLVSPIDPAIKAAVAKEIATSIEGESESKDDKDKGKKKKPHKDPARASIRDFSGKNHKFYFVYLGDIIELACKNAGLGKLQLGTGDIPPVFSGESYFPEDEKNQAVGYPLKNARILLGPIEYYNNKGDLKTINLSQFPISFKFFRAWFAKKIIRRARVQMPLGSFIVSLINDLVMPALGVGMPKSYKAPRTTSSLVSLTLPGKQVPGGGEVRGCGEGALRYVEALPKKPIIDIQSAEFEQNYYSAIKNAISSESLVKTSFDYLLVYVTTHKNIIERRGDPAEDVKDGIYHFNIGSDMGLLKSMKFTRVNIPNLVELRSKQSEEQGVDALDQLKFPYNTNLNLVGTSLFTPGMFYYVNPSLAGLGNVEDAASLAYKMNLGGYHLIQTVTTKITPGSFETIVVGTQTHQRKR